MARSLLIMFLCEQARYLETQALDAMAAATTAANRITALLREVGLGWRREEHDADDYLRAIREIDHDDSRPPAGVRRGGEPDAAPDSGRRSSPPGAGLAISSSPAPNASLGDEEPS